MAESYRPYEPDQVMLLPAAPQDCKRGLNTLVTRVFRPRLRKCRSSFVRAAELLTSVRNSEEPPRLSTVRQTAPELHETSG